MTLHQKPPYEDITFLTTILPHQNGVRTYFGRLVDVLPPGPYLGLPKIHKIAKVDMQAQVHPVKLSAVTKDNYSFPMQMDLTVRVLDAGKYMMVAPDSVAYGIDEILKSSVTHEITTRYTKEDLKTKREELSDIIRGAIERGASGWGIAVDVARLPTIAIPSVSYELAQQKMVIQKEGENRLEQLSWTARAVERETQIMTSRLRELAIVQSDMEMYNNLQLASAEAFETQHVGEAQALVLARKAGVLQEFMAESVGRLVAAGLSSADAKELMMYLSGTVFGRDSIQSARASDADGLREAMMGKVKAKIDGEAMKAQADAVGVDSKFIMLMNTFRAISGTGAININNLGALWENMGKV